MNKDELFMHKAIGIALHTFCDPTHHAEIGLIRKYCSEHHVFDLSEYTLYTSCEPCVMCSGAMVWSNLRRPDKKKFDNCLIFFSTSDSVRPVILGS